MIRSHYRISARQGQVDAIRPTHRQYLVSLKERASSPSPAHSPTARIIVYETNTAEAEALIKGDPFFHNGVFLKWQLRPWNTVFANRELFPA